VNRDIDIGQLLDARFEITARVEHAGMATVFKALDCETGRTVVIKIPQADVFTNPTSCSRLAEEAAILAKLDHPGIVKSIPMAMKSRPYLVLTYVEGQTLHDILKRMGPPPVCWVLQLASRLCDILEYMHRHQVVHSDLKPCNIIISDDGRPHLIDFGIAKQLHWRPFTLEFLSPQPGTLEYMAPEQMDGRRVDTRADIYSLGLIMYEILAGRRPVQDGGRIRPLRELNSEVSEPVEEIVLHALAPNTSDRYRSAAAMKAELDFPEMVQVTGKYHNPRKPNAWPKRLSLAGVVLGLAATPFILFYVFFLMFQRQLAP